MTAETKSVSMEGQPMGDPHPCDLTRAGQHSVTGTPLASNERLTKMLATWESAEKTHREFFRQHKTHRSLDYADMLDACIKELRAVLPVETGDELARMRGLYEYVGDMLQSDCTDEQWRVLRRLSRFFPQPVETGPSERAFAEKAAEPRETSTKPDAWLVVAPDGWRYLSGGEGDAQARANDLLGSMVYPLFRGAVKTSVTNEGKDNE